MRALLIVAAALSAPAIAAPPPGAAACSGCHAASVEIASQVPRLTGREPVEILKTMQEFRSGKRPATVMDRIAKGFTDDEIRAIAAWYGSQR